MPGATNLKDCEVLESLVKKQVADGKLYAAICGSPAVALGSWGVLKGLKVSTKPLLRLSFFQCTFVSLEVIESELMP